MAKVDGIAIAYTGDGKGKTTAALGMAFRAAGYAKKVLIIQFIKSSTVTGEIAFAKKISNIEIKSFGLGFVEIGNDQRPKSDHQKAARKALEAAKKAINSDMDLLVLDEVFVAVSLSLLGEEQIIELLREKKPRQTIVLTGRGASPAILRHCDLVTEMKNIKHPFDQGRAAIKSIDF